MTNYDYPGYLYAFLIAGGGIAGYITAGSVMSLVMGLLFGVLAGLGAYRCSARREQYLLGLLVSLAMLGRFGQAFYKSGEMWPHGFVAIASLLMAFRYIYTATGKTTHTS